MHVCQIQQTFVVSNNFTFSRSTALTAVSNWLLQHTPNFCSDSNETWTTQRMYSKEPCTRAKTWKKAEKTLRRREKVEEFFPFKVKNYEKKCRLAQKPKTSTKILRRNWKIIRKKIFWKIVHSFWLLHVFMETHMNLRIHINNKFCEKKTSVFFSRSLSQIENVMFVVSKNKSTISQQSICTWRVLFLTFDLKMSTTSDCSHKVYNCSDKIWLYIQFVCKEEKKMENGNNTHTQRK